MPNRILREGILTSDRVNTLDCHAELFYRRLMSIVDDYGRFDARPSVLRVKCYPLRVDTVHETDIERWLSSVVGAGLVRVYSVSGKPYLEIEDFRQRTRTPSQYPDPPAEESFCQSDDGQMTVICQPNDGQMTDTCQTFARLGVRVGVAEGEGVREAVGEGVVAPPDNATEEPSDAPSAATSTPTPTAPVKRAWTHRYITEEQAWEVIHTLRDVPRWPADDREDIKLVCRLANQYHCADVLLWAANDLAINGGVGKDGQPYPNLRTAYHGFVETRFRGGGRPPGKLQSGGDRTNASVLAEQAAFLEKERAKWDAAKGRSA